MTECRKSPHCWHLVGVFDEQHGPYAPEPITSRRVFGCCDCAVLETTDGQVVLASEVRFDCAETKARLGA